MIYSSCKCQLLGLLDTKWNAIHTESGRAVLNVGIPIEFIGKTIRDEMERSITNEVGRIQMRLWITLEVGLAPR